MKVYRSYQKSIAYDNKKKCEACKGDKKLDRPLEFSYRIEIEIDTFNLIYFKILKIK